MPEVEAVEGKGLRQDLRYFRRGDPGYNRQRQVSLIDEGTIWRHEAAFGPLDRSLIKAQIILAGDLRLPDLLGATLVFDGGAELTLSLPRKPCFAMDLIAAGLKDAMTEGNQGALARVTRSGVIRPGQRVVLRTSDELERNPTTVAV
jgi:MOSC domain-containing protein YiiM